MDVEVEVLSVDSNHGETGATGGHDGDGNNGDADMSTDLIHGKHARPIEALGNGPAWRPSTGKIPSAHDACCMASIDDLAARAPSIG